MESGTTGSVQPEKSDSKCECTLAGKAKGLVVLLLLAIGVANWNKDGALVSYHNDFAKEAFNTVFYDKWNAFLKIAQRSDSNGSEFITYLKNEMIPSIEAWQKKASISEPPQYANEFHTAFVGNLQSFSKDAHLLLQALEKDDADLAASSSRSMSDTAKKVEKNLQDFRTKLAKEREITFEK